MANRYWVGGTASWNGTAGSKWALTSGGASGQAEPTSSDDVFFDANSGAVTVTVDTTARVCKSLNFTGFTGTLAASAVGITVSGNLTFGSGMTLNYTRDFTIDASSTITSNGKTFNGGFILGAVGATIQLADDLNAPSVSASGNTASLSAGTFTANNFNVTFNRFSLVGALTRVINMGTGTWTITGNDLEGTAWNVNNSTNLTINASTSVLKFTSNSTSQVRMDPGVSMTYGTIWVATQNTGRFYIINNSFTCAVFKADAGRSIRWTNGKNITVSSAAGVILTGTAGNLITIDTDSAGVSGGLIVSSGTVTCDYLSLKDNAASGGAAFFYAGANSTNVSGNSGWTFTGPPSTARGHLSLLGVA